MITIPRELLETLMKIAFESDHPQRYVWATAQSFLKEKPINYVGTNVCAHCKRLLSTYRGAFADFTVHDDTGQVAC